MKFGREAPHNSANSVGAIWTLDTGHWSLPQSASPPNPLLKTYLTDAVSRRVSIQPRAIDYNHGEGSGDKAGCHHLYRRSFVNRLAMDALLDSHQQRGNHVCGSIDDLQGQLHHFLLSKSSDTRAEHASLTFELRYNVVFHINTDSDNGRSDSAEPAQSQPPPSQQPEATRPVAASETIQDQPSDDPILQKAVAKHIIGKISMVDGSTWNVRQVARGAQGWTFTYICKDSHQAWSRANAKNPERPVIGSFSGNGGLDPINLCKLRTNLTSARWCQVANSV